MHDNEDGYKITGEWQNYLTLRGLTAAVGGNEPRIVQNNGPQVIEYFFKALDVAPSVNAIGSTFLTGGKNRQSFTVPVRGAFLFMRTLDRKSTSIITLSTR